MKTRWLDRTISEPGPFMAMCFSEREFLQACRKINCTTQANWVSEGANATVHYFRNGASLTVLVCLGDVRGRTPVQIAGLLVHEAVHVWQEYCANIGEGLPGKEQEAYGIQNLSQTLMQEYARRML